MISVGEAVALVAAGLRPLAAEQVSLAQALGRVLAKDVAARLTQPPADVSSMDGYAVRAADAAGAPVDLALIGESAAGTAFAGSVGQGQAVRISTGAPLPDGADAVAIQERCERVGGAIRILEAPVAGRWIRPRGMDFAEGQVLLRAGRVLTARDVGLAAAMNVPWLKVRRRPRIALVATGDEVVMPGDPLSPHQIVSSNSLALAAFVEAFGGEPVNLGIARDDEAALRTLVDGGRGSDLLVTTGGASVGDHDLVRKVLGTTGFDLGFHRVAMRPGKPLLYGRLGETPVLGLPGNPVSVGVTAMLFLRPAMEAMLGIVAERQLSTAILGRDLPGNDERQDYLRARFGRSASGELTALPFDRQDSALLALFAEADCLVVRPPHAPPARAGEAVPIVALRHALLSS
jgi:molybdopterin molybdotransferase